MLCLYAVLLLHGGRRFNFFKFTIQLSFACGCDDHFNHRPKVAALSDCNCTLPIRNSNQLVSVAQLAMSWSTNGSQCRRRHANRVRKLPILAAAEYQIAALSASPFTRTSAESDQDLNNDKIGHNPAHQCLESAPRLPGPAIIKMAFYTALNTYIDHRLRARECSQGFLHTTSQLLSSM